MVGTWSFRHCQFHMKFLNVDIDSSRDQYPQPIGSSFAKIRTSRPLPYFPADSRVTPSDTMDKLSCDGKTLALSARNSCPGCADERMTEATLV